MVSPRWLKKIKAYENAILVLFSDWKLIGGTFQTALQRNVDNATQAHGAQWEENKLPE